MSRESLQWLNQNILRGYTKKRGRAWHYSAAHQGSESNHYDGAIPVEDCDRRLFGWRAVPRPIYIDYGTTVTAEAESDETRVTSVPMLSPYGDMVAWCRSDTGEVLGIHSDGYKGHQYGEWLVKNVENLVDGDLAIASAGLLRNGAVAWVQIERPENVTTPNGVTIRPFIMATTSFDGSIATTYQDGYTDTVCDNTRETFLAENGNRYRVKHTRNSAFNVYDARTALSVLNRATDLFVAEIDTLCAVDVSDAEWQKFVEAHVPLADGASARATTMAENKRQTLTKMWNTDTRVAPWRNTAWGVLQATNTYLHHESIVKGTNRVERNMLNAITHVGLKADREALATLKSILGDGPAKALSLAAA